MAPKPRATPGPKVSARSKSAADGKIRIIGGRWRGRKLPVPDLTGLRPTTDRLRETLFNWLQFELQGKAVLDAFAGTGSLGLEALSRGAAQVTFVEATTPAFRQLRENLRTLATEADVIQGDALLYLSATGGPFDVVFLDPPFGHGFVQKAVDALNQEHWLNPGAWVYIETEVDAQYQTPAHWQLHREKAAGQVRACLFKLPG